MAIEVFNRYEHKYMLDEETFKRVTALMDTHMIPDSHNANHKLYTIANIYYDTDDDYLIRKSLAKPAYKEKLRLRSYGIPNSNSKVFLEIKKKYKGLVNKRRTTLKLGEAYEFINSGVKPRPADYMNCQVLNELEYFMKVYTLVPKVYIAYDRLAYFEKDNPDLRISFDTNIRTRRCDLMLEHGTYGSRLLDRGAYLMEIKTSRAMPIWLADMLCRYDIKRRSFSKYGTEYKNYITSEKSTDEIKAAI